MSLLIVDHPLRNIKLQLSRSQLTYLVTKYSLMQLSYSFVNLMVKLSTSVNSSKST